jgi:hypothetical protein
MCTRGQFISAIIFLLASFQCPGAGHTDSVTPRHKTSVAEQNIGDHDYHKFGPVAIEQRDNKYYITFPVLLYTDDNYYSDEDKVMPRGTKIILLLDDSEIVSAETNDNSKVRWYYTYNSYILDPLKVYDVRLPDQHYVFPAVNRDHDNYGLCWRLTFEFTGRDILLLSKHRILDGYVLKGSKKIFLPIKHRQSVKIQRAIRSL